MAAGRLDGRVALVTGASSGIGEAVARALPHLGPEVRVNAVAPGLVDTPWTADWHAIRETVRASSPMRRSAAPQDVAHLVVAQVTSDLVTGEVWLVDSGLGLRH